jgi:hypothetical protein
VLYRAIFWAENLAFAPTIWLTKPLGRWANSMGLLGVVTLCEVLLLSAFYASIAYLAMRGKLRESADRYTGGHSWLVPLVWVALVVLALARDLWQ